MLPFQVRLSWNWLPPFLLGFACLLTCQQRTWAEAPCGLEAMSETTEAVYPPIAKVAHVNGVVVLIASFNADGSVTQVNVVNGPELVKKAAAQFVQGWKANPYSGPRACPIAITFVIGPADLSGRQDVQHYTVAGLAPCLCDPSPVVSRRRKRFLFF
jgi:hypothetical protein